RPGQSTAEVAEIQLEVRPVCFNVEARYLCALRIAALLNDFQCALKGCDGFAVVAEHFVAGAYRERALPPVRPILPVRHLLELLKRLLDPAQHQVDVPEALQAIARRHELAGASVKRSRLL